MQSAPKTFAPLASPFSWPQAATIYTGSAPPSPGMNLSSPFAGVLSQSVGNTQEIFPGYSAGTASPMELSPGGFMRASEVPALLRSMADDAVKAGLSVSEFLQQINGVRDLEPHLSDAISDELTLVLYSYVMTPAPLDFRPLSPLPGFTPPSPSWKPPSPNMMTNLSPATPGMPTLSPQYRTTPQSPTDMLDLRRSSLQWGPLTPQSPWTQSNSPASRPPSAPLSYSNVSLSPQKLLSFPPKPTQINFSAMASPGPLNLFSGRPPASAVYNAPY